jgi:hypothetical protein
MFKSDQELEKDGVKEIPMVKAMVKAMDESDTASDDVSDDERCT